MKVEIKIEFNWEPNDTGSTPIEHKEALMEDAYDRIFEMIKQGYTSGELHTNIRYGKDVVEQEDEDDGLSYSGWWSMRYQIHLNK